VHGVVGGQRASSDGALEQDLMILCKLSWSLRTINGADRSGHSIFVLYSFYFLINSQHRRLRTKLYKHVMSAYSVVGKATEHLLFVIFHSAYKRGLSGGANVYMAPGNGIKYHIRRPLPSLQTFDLSETVGVVRFVKRGKTACASPIVRARYFYCVSELRFQIQVEITNRKQRVYFLSYCLK